MGIASGTAYLARAQDGFSGILLLGAILYSPPALLFVVGAIGVSRRTRWGYPLAQTIHVASAMLFSVGALVATGYPHLTIPLTLLIAALLSVAGLHVAAWARLRRAMKRGELDRN